MTQTRLQRGLGVMPRIRKPHSRSPSSTRALQRGLGVMPRISMSDEAAESARELLQRGLGVMPRIRSAAPRQWTPPSWLQRGLGVMPRIRETLPGPVTTGLLRPGCERSRTPGGQTRPRSRFLLGGPAYIPDYQGATPRERSPAYARHWSARAAGANTRHTITGSCVTGSKLALPRLVTRGSTRSAGPMSITTTWSSS